jgi:regulator of protease activity HflC (stomatin/prohibitin superfamily)
MFNKTVTKPNPFNKIFYATAAIATIAFIASVVSLGFTRIETGEVGVRVGWDKQIKPGELKPGSFNQSFIGSVLSFPVKDVNVQIENMTPVAKDNSTMKDLDVTVVYNLNPDQVAELYSTKNRAFHAETKGDIYLMYNYVVQNTRNALYKAARKYDALDMADNRSDMENFVKEEITRNLAEEKLDGSITISQVLIRNVVPADSVVASANELVRAKNELKQKEIEVKTAEAEARRMAALANNSASSIAFMQAQAALNISEGIKNGKVQTIVVPANFNALMMSK